MQKETVDELISHKQELLEVGVVLGQSHAFGLIAGRCSAAQAEALRRLREQKLYKRCAEKWEDFCPEYLKMSRSEADRTIKLLQEFGPAYFELSQLMRISPETFRAIAPHIGNGALEHNGELIELKPENSRRIAAAVCEMRGAAPRKTPEFQQLEREVKDLCRSATVAERISKLNRCCTALIAQFEKIAADEALGIQRMLLNSVLARVLEELGRLAQENGLPVSQVAA